MSARIEARVSRMKNKGRQAFTHSKIELIQNCTRVRIKVRNLKWLQSVV